MSAQSAVILPFLGFPVSRPRLVIAVVAATALLCSGVTSCTKTQVGLSAAAISAVVVGTTVGVTLAVQHSRHTLQGCISSGAAGPELRLADAKVYTLTGVLDEVKVGDRLKIHGSKVKKVKSSSPGDHVFVVEKVNKDYGPCPVNFATPSVPKH